MTPEFVDHKGGEGDGADAALGLSQAVDVSVRCERALDRQRAGFEIHVATRQCEQLSIAESRPCRHEHRGADVFWHLSREQSDLCRRHRAPLTGAHHSRSGDSTRVGEDQAVVGRVSEGCVKYLVGPG